MRSQRLLFEQTSADALSAGVSLNCSLSVVLDEYVICTINGKSVELRDMSSLLARHITWILRTQHSREQILFTKLRHFIPSIFVW